MSHNSYIILYATLLNLITVAFIFVYPIPLRVARLGIFYNLFPHQMVIWVTGMLLAGILAILGFFTNKWYRFLYFLPQHIFLLLTTGSAIIYIIRGVYADGVVRPWQFIFLDQLPIILATLMYGLAIFDYRKKHEN